MRILPVVTLLVLLSGCSSYIQAIDGYATAAATSIRDAEDLNLKRIKFGLCATPVSALVRNPEYAGSIKELCLGKSSVTVDEVLSIPSATPANSK